MISKKKLIFNKMNKGLKSLSKREYPGRVIILGKDKSGEKDVVIYAITGRSPSSQARKLELENDGIWAKPTDEEVLKKGNRDLLIYPAMFFYRGIVVSNGKQTIDIKASLGEGRDPAEILELALHNWDYEPDSPIFTPRISGCILPQKTPALSIIRRGPDGSSIKNIYEIPLEAGKGKMITTYAGENRDPLSTFSEEPVDIEIEEEKADAMAEAVYNALEPEQGKKDFRVALACVFSSDVNSGEFEIYIINKYERMGR